MSINLAEIQQKVNSLLYNMSEQNRKAYQLFYDPTPQDVELPQLDENGNLITVKIPNRAKIKAEVDSFISGARGEYPITPNLLKNTRFFKWSDETIDLSNPNDFGSKENQWFENTLPQFWGWYNFKSSDGVVGDTTFKAKTIHVKNTTAWAEEGLPSLDQVPLVSSSNGAELVRALILDITRTRGRTAIFTQDCHQYTSWHVGNFTVTEKFYFTILSRTGDIKLALSGNRFPKFWIGEQQGVWHHVTVHSNGFGGCIQGHLEGSGTMKVAILLPFVTFGYLPDDMHVWAGYVGSDATAYSHGDLIVSSSALAKEPW